MAVIEFKNLETLEAFKPIINEIEKETQTRQSKIKHGLVLLKNGLYWEGIE